MNRREDGWRVKDAEEMTKREDWLEIALSTKKETVLFDDSNNSCVAVEMGKIRSHKRIRLDKPNKYNNFLSLSKIRFCLGNKKYFRQKFF